MQPSAARHLASLRLTTSSCIFQRSCTKPHRAQPARGPGGRTPYQPAACSGRLPRPRLARLWFLALCLSVPEPESVPTMAWRPFPGIAAASSTPALTFAGKKAGANEMAPRSRDKCRTRSRQALPSAVCQRGQADVRVACC
ncbi:hypothetical protein B0T14DRAFT_510800 [Immersiella caudata]|uniref:Uncharacterized protein n=1 Tax=Immersiella caudata TaxID=314043 RepID=A0AA39X3Q9_9PEZI|nr:hypothetical protein B0T14DRAFT_510800 [Immersiella caudata]